MIFYPDVMVDIETTSTQPDLGCIIQLSAVKFNLSTFTIDISSPPFDQCLFPMSRRFWDEGTRNWWFGNEGRADYLTNGIFPRMRDPVEVLREFREWLGCYGAEPAAGVRMWSRGRFDDQFISSHLRDANLGQVFDFRLVTDLRSFERGMFYPGGLPEYDMGIKREGTHHNGLDDCFHQIKVLFAAVKRAQQGVVL